MNPMALSSEFCCLKISVNDQVSYSYIFIFSSQSQNDPEWNTCIDVNHIFVGKLLIPHEIKNKVVEVNLFSVLKIIEIVKNVVTWYDHWSTKDYPWPQMADSLPTRYSDRGNYNTELCYFQRWVPRVLVPTLNSPNHLVLILKFDIWCSMPKMFMCYMLSVSILQLHEVTLPVLRQVDDSTYNTICVLIK